MKVPIYAVAGLFLVSVSVSAQTLLPGRDFLPPSPELIQYLGLTDNQAAAIRQTNNSFQQFTTQKYIRNAQVQSELALETARPTLDPMALGLRYLELEAIRREIAAEETRTRTTVQAILTDLQKAKLKSLEDAMKLQPLICDAQSARILNPLVPASFVLGGIISQMPIPSDVFLADRFSPTFGCGGPFGISTVGVFTPGQP